MIGQTVKITVLKKLDLKDDLGVKMPGLAENAEPSLMPMAPGCHIFHEGQSFLYRLEDDVPDGFCGWAWNDIFKDILAVASRAAVQPDVPKSDIEPAYACCTDGIRPVIFKIEAFVGE